MSQTTPHGMACPTCKVSLIMSERQGVEIDYCPQCRGVWLDRGELDKIIERSSQDMRVAPAPAPVPQQYAATGYHHGKPKRRKSFLEELFD